MIAMDIAERVYETLLRNLEPEYCVSWVEPIFIPGHSCYEDYCDMNRAYEQLRIRIGAGDEDADAEEIINCLLKHGKSVALEMFRYGMLYQIKKDEEQPGA